MYLAYLIVLVLVLTLDARRFPRIVVPAWVKSDGAFAVALAASTASFVATVLVDASGGERTWHGVALPFAVVGIPNTEHFFCSDVSTGAAIVQTTALAIFLARLTRGSLTRVQTVVVYACIAIAVTVAVAVPAIGSADLYAYAGYTTLADPYRLQHEHLAPAFRAVESLWSYPMIPSVYGPLWNALSRVATGSLPTLGERLYALRALAVVAFALVAIAYARLRDRPTALLLIAANPGLLEQFVFDAHNDLWGVGLVLLALRPGSGVVARIVLVAAAGCIKLPLLVPAAVVFSSMRPLVLRIVAPCCAAALAIGAAILLHADASRTVAMQTGYRSLLPAVAFAHYALAVVCIALIAGGLLFGRFVRFGGFSTLALGINPNPWYLAWGFPYAVVAGRDRTFLVAFPLVASLADSSYDSTPLRLVVGGVVFALVLALAARELAGQIGPRVNAWRAR